MKYLIVYVSSSKPSRKGRHYPTHKQQRGYILYSIKPTSSLPKLLFMALISHNCSPHSPFFIFLSDPSKH